MLAVLLCVCSGSDLALHPSPAFPASPPSAAIATTFHGLEPASTAAAAASSPRLRVPSAAHAGGAAELAGCALLGVAGTALVARGLRASARATGSLASARSGLLTMEMPPHTSSPSSPCSETATQDQSGAARRGTPAMGLFDFLDPQQGSTPEPGKFVRHSELAPGCAPLGVLVAGFDEDQLEAIAGVLESVVFPEAEGEAEDGKARDPLPIVPLGAQDFKPRVRLRDVLAQLQERDSVLPDTAAPMNVPLVLLSGFSPIQTSAAVRALGGLGLRGGTASSRPVFAAAVPKALDKPLLQLREELEGDFWANQPEDR